MLLLNVLHYTKRCYYFLPTLVHIKRFDCICISLYRSKSEIMKVLVLQWSQDS